MASVSVACGKRIGFVTVEKFGTGQDRSDELKLSGPTRRLNLNNNQQLNQQLVLRAVAVGDCSAALTCIGSWAKPGYVRVRLASHREMSYDGLGGGGGRRPVQR
ncbi:hypothetical protein NM208_g14521 [Fusarium decemcellulare]|uniref:Uncharacterized protein n=1 Tax=Fusarium decemcellulare TaxID=57161 RepID=A0ACC1RI95_9HYPO|nr:hypothetical protein NM208_g14521 [Fusarium decemcellulare]